MSPFLLLASIAKFYFNYKLMYLPKGITTCYETLKLKCTVSSRSIKSSVRLSFIPSNTHITFNSSRLPFMYINKARHMQWIQLNTERVC
jgi:hypothetical protein